MGLAQAATEEAKAAMRAQLDRVVAEFDLVGGDEFEVLQQEVVALRAEIARLTSKPAKSARAKQEAG
jgi:BMFP domain-containing protein YqiC